MCAICGCGAGEHPEHHHEHGADHPHVHRHPHGHAHDHGHVHPHAVRDRGLVAGARMERIEQELLAKNDELASRNRAWFAERSIAALNLIGAPGAGKTSLLEATAQRLAGTLAISVLEGDQETDADARRIRDAGCNALQINTGAGCHLDASMIDGAMARLEPPPGSLLFIENVGNLVCPALFDLGERSKVVVLSVTEGADKPLKYPHVFRASDLFVLNKVDLLPHVSFDVGACVANARRVNPGLGIFEVSATTGEGMDAWCDWLLGLAGARGAAGGEATR